MFSLHEQQYALPYTVVEKIVRAAAITPLPEPIPDILGIINIHGQMIPVISLYQRFNLPEVSLNIHQYLVVCRTDRFCAVLVDNIDTVINIPTSEQIAVTTILPYAHYVEKIIKYRDNTLILLNVEALSLPLPVDSTINTARESDVS